MNSMGEGQSASSDCSLANAGFGGKEELQVEIYVLSLVFLFCHFVPMTKNQGHNP